MTRQPLAIVLGASRGLGLALCESLALRGHALLCFSRSEMPPGLQARHHALDLADTARSIATVRRALRELDERALGDVLCICNAAGLGPVAPVGLAGSTGLIDLAGLQRNLALNLATPMAVLATLVAHWQAHSGRKRLAHISSAVVLRPQPGLALYGAAKAGMQHFLQTLALEQASQPHPFVPVSIDPGAMDTAMQLQLRGEADLPARASFQQRHAAGRLRHPGRVATAIVDHLLAPQLEPGSAFRVPDSAL